MTGQEKTEQGKRESGKREQGKQAQRKGEQESRTQERRERSRTELERRENCWEWFCSIPGIYRGQREILLKCFKTPEAVWLAEEKEFAYLKEKGLAWAGRVEQFKKKQSPEETAHIRAEKGIQFISQEHEAYPGRLRQLGDRPQGIFYKGTLPAEERKAVAIVGARVCTRYGKETAEGIAGVIAGAGGCVISGAASGVDGVAQWAALEQGGTSCAVVGCGPDVQYPSSNGRLFERLAGEGCILSEFPPGTPPLRFHFPQRNRIISGLSDLVVVVEARRKSGSLITADFAAEQGKNVMAVPGRMGDELSAGCNELIAQGAGIILSEEAFLRELFPEIQGEKKGRMDEIALAPSENLVYSSLDLHSKSLYELAECIPLSLSQLSDSLLSLELKGLIREVERNYYAKVK